MPARSRGSNHAVALLPLLLLFQAALRCDAQLPPSPPLPPNPPTASPPWEPGGFNPCANYSAIKTGDSFTLGLLFITGANASAVNIFINQIRIAYEASNLTSEWKGVCTPNVTSTLAALGARFAVYSARVDRLQLLQIPYSDIVLPMAALPADRPPLTLVIAFAGSVYSSAMYLASADTNYTFGYGFVQTLSMMATFDRGILTYLNWWGTNCDGCGGSTAGICFHQPAGVYQDPKVRSCATPLENCTCSGQGTPAWACNYNSGSFAQCNTGIQVAWIGTDRQYATFKTGPQIQRLSSLSIVSLYFKVFNYLEGIYNASKASVTANWGQIQGEAALQSLDSNGIFGKK